MTSEGLEPLSRWAILRYSEIKNKGHGRAGTKAWLSSVVVCLGCSWVKFIRTRDAINISAVCSNTWNLRLWSAVCNWPLISSFSFCSHSRRFAVLGSQHTVKNTRGNCIPYPRNSLQEVALEIVVGFQSHFVNDRTYWRLCVYNICPLFS